MTVSGKITSTETISLSKAAKVLSNFVAAETGASQAVSTYLCRALAAFNELVQFHKALKASKSGCKLKKHAQESTHSEAPRKHAQKPEENEVDVNDGGGSHSARKKHKKNRNENVERDGGDSTVIEEGNRKERKKKRKRKSAEVDDEEIIVFSEECSLKKKKRRRKIEDED
ncbi:hypothetical protein U1Q18_000153 [Sarracenia purpurea var. burkii]